MDSRLIGTLHVSFFDWGASFMSSDNPAQTTEQTSEVIRRFNDVFQKHDPSALSMLVAEDCVVENTQPAPDGARHVGREACVALWTGIATAPGTHFDLEDVFVAGERAIIRWRYFWGEGEANSMRGVNLMRVRHGLIVEGMGYVKGN
jgi:SnoaL-like domain